jgi:NOL1/NOP2/sun family putative RNA methylase
MAPVSILAPKPGETVLDLCAAPGGKSTQIADFLQGEGLLVCNEPVPSRAKILSRNIERMGVCNALVVSADPDKLKGPWEGLFDAILVDAPCSGEGMFRRHPETRTEWNEQSPEGCATRQKRILDAAWQMLRPGGRLCYSTCTLNTIENEGVVRYMLDSCPDAETIPFSLPNADGQTLPAPEGMLHLYPHQLKGEGHFVALFHKKGESDAPVFRPAAQELAPVTKEQQAAYASFCSSAKAQLPPANALFGDVLLHCPPLPPLRSIKVLRAGLQLGTMKGKLFFPDHALAVAALPHCGFPAFETDASGAESYLRGETLPCPESLSGFVHVKYMGLSLGFGKASGGQVKNHYPKGLRKP